MRSFCKTPGSQPLVFVNGNSCSITEMIASAYFNIFSRIAPVAELPIMLMIGNSRHFVVHHSNL